MAEIHGSLLSLSQRVIGDQIDTAASAGATVLSLDDVSDFDEGGGSVTINGTVYAYTAVDMDADTVTLGGTGLAASVAVGDRVDLWDTDNGVNVSEYQALVVHDGQDDGDPITATVDHALTPLLAQTTLVTGQSVSLVRDGDEWVLTKVHGKTQNGLTRSLTGYVQYGADNFDGTVTGLEVDTTATPWQVRLLAQSPGGGVRVQAQDRTTYLAIAASAFNISSGIDLKTDIAPAPDALAIVADAVAQSWRYLTDEEGVIRVGPMANDLPAWMTTVDPIDGHLSLDLARQNGILWAAFGQQLEINRALSDRIAALEKPKKKGPR